MPRYLPFLWLNALMLFWFIFISPFSISLWYIGTSSVLCHVALIRFPHDLTEAKRNIFFSRFRLSDLEWTRVTRLRDWFFNWKGQNCYSKSYTQSTIDYLTVRLEAWIFESWVMEVLHCLYCVVLGPSSSRRSTRRECEKFKPIISKDIWPLILSSGNSIIPFCALILYHLVSSF